MSEAHETVIAVAQFAPTNDLATNVAEIRSLAGNAVARGATLVVFPEYSSYFLPNLGQELVDAAEPLNGAFVGELAAVASDFGIHVVAGMAEKIDEPGRFANTVVAVDPGGALVATYRKLQLYDAFGASESEWVRAGDVEAPQTFTFGDFTVGLQTCYDLRFPEVTRRLVDAGATLVLVPSEWVAGPLKEEHWRVLVAARALENTIYVAAADHTPPVGVGHSMIVDPMGVTVASGGEVRGVSAAAISRSRVADARLVNPALALRRFAVVPR